MIKTEQARRQHTAHPSKYPQGRFKEKECKKCASVFQPCAPSQKYCSTECASEAQQDAYYIRTYGISREVWKTMAHNQGGLCFICREEGFLMKEGHEATLMVDHCHRTGTVRGLLCHNCNRALGLLKDDPARLRQALEYLEGATTILSEE